MLLRQVAQRFDRTIGNATTKARLGGDEFAAILGTASESEIDRICNAILHTLDAPFVIEQNQIALRYQPKVDLRSGYTRGVEALVHWNHPLHGIVPAHQFVPVAERTGLIHALSRWVLRTAIAQCDAWRRVGLEIPVAVNLSPRNFHDEQLPGYIERLQQRHKLPAKLIEIEITESVILTDAQHISSALHDLSRKGMRIFIDDFGTGYSSLGHLKKLPVTGVKIDRMFISQVTSHAHDAAIVR